MFYKVMAVMFLDMLTSIGLTLLAILIISLLLTVDLTISFLSCAAVAATVVDTAGLAHFWGLVVEPFFAVLLQNNTPLFSIIVQPLPRCCSLSPPGSLSTTPPTWGTASLYRFSSTSITPLPACNEYHQIKLTTAIISPTNVQLRRAPADHLG